ncbi:MAG: hypothetical protein JXN61_12105 [Sedimentisphaerales bacterium]|nr:hypothetical protein [Sedimentisphaerales bacterium]
MQRSLILSACILLFLTLGCHQGPAAHTDSARCIVEGGGPFPGFLVGVWRNGEHGWEFTFEPDGSISSIVLSLGRIRLKQGEVAEIPMIKGGKGVFTPGDWKAYYTPSTRELTVKISIKDFRIEVADNILEGKSTDVFLGEISEDGKTWQTVWTSFPDYMAHTPENPNFEMKEESEYGNQQGLVFNKVETPS